MREIVHIQVGQCGNQLGVNFWEMICDEHAIDSEGNFRGFSPLQLDKLNVFFSCCNNGRYVPRAILVDLESSVLAAIKNSDAGLLFKPDNYIYAKSGAANNWARGFYSNGQLLIEPVLEVVRKECEQAECIQGFQMVHSLGGGTGSGLGALIVSRIREEYPDKLIITHSVIPTPKVSNVVVEPYNTLLAINQMIETTDESCIYDNEALANICVRKLALKNPIFADLNHLISFAMSGATTCLRFPGQLNADLRKLAVNMVPFPRLHFFATAFAPLIPRNLKTYQLPADVHQLTDEAFDVGNMMMDCDRAAKSKYLCVATIFRGAVSMKEVEQNIADLNAKHRNDFVNWIPNNFNAAVCDIPNRDAPISVTFICNTTCIRHVFTRATSGSDVMRRKKAFLHWYTAEGLQESEFDEAQMNVDQLIEEYLHYEQKTSSAPEAAATAGVRMEEFPSEHGGGGYTFRRDSSNDDKKTPSGPPVGRRERNGGKTFRRDDEPFHRDDEPFHRDDEPFHRDDEPFHRDDKPFHRDDEPYDDRDSNDDKKTPSGLFGRERNGGKTFHKDDEFYDYIPYANDVNVRRIPAATERHDEEKLPRYGKTAAIFERPDADESNNSIGRKMMAKRPQQSCRLGEFRRRLSSHLSNAALLRTEDDTDKDDGAGSRFRKEKELNNNKNDREMSTYEDQHHRGVPRSSKDGNGANYPLSREHSDDDYRPKDVKHKYTSIVREIIPQPASVDKQEYTDDDARVNTGRNKPNLSMDRKDNEDVINYRDQHRTRQQRIAPPHYYPTNHSSNVPEDRRRFTGNNYDDSHLTKQRGEPTIDRQNERAMPQKQQLEEFDRMQNDDDDYGKDTNGGERRQYKDRYHEQEEDSMTYPKKVDPENEEHPSPQTSSYASEVVQADWTTDDETNTGYQKPTKQ